MIEFRWKCSYMNEIWFEVLGDGDRYEMVYRTGTSDYELSICNGGAERYYRDCAPLVGWLRREMSGPLSPEVVRAYNAWRVAERDEWVAQLTANPQRYGHMLDEWRDVTYIAKGSVRWVGGWAAEGGHFEFAPLEPELIAA